MKKRKWGVIVILMGAIALVALYGTIDSRAGSSQTGSGAPTSPQPLLVGPPKEFETPRIIQAADYNAIIILLASNPEGPQFFRVGDRDVAFISKKSLEARGITVKNVSGGLVEVKIPPLRFKPEDYPMIQVVPNGFAFPLTYDHVEVHEGLEVLYPHPSIQLLTGIPFVTREVEADEGGQ